MAPLPILKWPDARLSRRCDPVATIDDAVRQLAADMLETMYAAPGRGLAGPQVGAMVRMFVMDVGWKDGTPDPVTVVNPEVIWRGDDLAEGAEGCLSIPGVTALVTRPTTIRLRWTGLDGALREETLTGFAATCAQHEYDHLDGFVTFDRLNPEARALLEAEYAA